MSSKPSAGTLRAFGSIRVHVPRDEPRLVEVEYADGFTVADFRSVMEFVATYGAERGSIAILSEVRGTIPAGPAKRKELGDIVSELDRKTKGAVCASAVVTDSALMRGVLTAVGWVYSPGYPLKPFSSDGEAREWLLSQLATRAR